MTLHGQRGRFERLLKPFAAWCAERGVSPNTVSLAGLAITLAAAALYLWSSEERWWALVAGSAVLGLGTTLDSADGILARMTDQTSALGDYLDHSFDRFADVALLLGIAFSPFASVEVGLFAVVGTLLTSYMGTQAQAVGVGRNYGGLMGRADRMALLIIVPPIEAARVLFEYELPAGLTLLQLTLVWIAIAGNLTALQRFWGGARALGRPPREE